MPVMVDLQHPKLVAKPPSGSFWMHEIKFDGYRLQLRVQAGQVTIHTRNGHDWTTRFPEIVADASALPDCILDGELCAVDAKGHPTFSALRSAIGKRKTGGLMLFVFDALWGAGEDLRPSDLRGRKAVLADILEAAPSSRLRWVDHCETGGEALLRSACSIKLEGVVSKRWDAPYRGGRNDSWVKSKCRPSQEVVIGGWKQAPGEAFGGLLVGTFEGGRLRYAGSVMTGFGNDKSRDLLPRLKALETTSASFETGDPPRKTSEIHWVRPELVANVDIAEWTASGKLRQASFKGLREDKEPFEVVRDKPDEGEI